jgi:putative transposase
VIVTPSTVLRWQRRRFRAYWTRLSGRAIGGRPPVNAEIRTLVTRMATANPLWGAPRIHGELLKLGIEVAERTVSRLMPKPRPEPSQTWRTFLANHVRDLVVVDFFTLPTARLRVLFVFVVLAHDRRLVVHFNVTEYPTAHWASQQIVDAFPDDSAPSCTWGAGRESPALTQGGERRVPTMASTGPLSRLCSGHVPLRVPGYFGTYVIR